MDAGNITRLITLPDRKAELGKTQADHAEHSRQLETYFLDLEEMFDLGRDDIYEAMRLVQEGISEADLETWASNRRVLWTA